MGHTVGFFDARVPLFILFLSLLILAGRVVKDHEKSRQFIILLAFNPAMLGYFLEGRDDIFMYVFLFAAFFFLQKDKNLWSGICMGIAFAIKQSVWPIFPFYVAYLFFQTEKTNILRTIKLLIPFIVTSAIIILPFLLWNPQAFLQSTVFYLSGNDPHSYPVAGYGVGSMLHQF